MVKTYRPGSVGMIPARPGTYLAHVYFDDNQVELVKSNVVGWQVGSERTITPLVVDPRAVGDKDWTVIHPDGRVECTTGQVWDDCDAWVAQQRRLRRAAA